ncbi:MULTISPECIES: SGNH/GDSL hydrolase family protein [Mycolicibacterium]|uniref:Lipolytic enzyme, G-D-S-L family n=1 Tax=Mycolicibacterium vanbaalenii (strain DSM 7251 / JCM 13017 / BCRC 16820 / KCTC 9966 / NRRL B-24157 / PYR-1) TaxID=350058 RepID=A1TE51_MYCVP|nr:MULTISPECIES: SGNH/GDSL hydrolase family protein [Mycolicibacterium]ABM15451.1 lipolytic enzyme, G-D-S-L family [Mycolicibacterium vanbaalenii PYR-1]MDW5612912.1 SGNH/GDSL hydrolase family protein [Mycolicibacterium sp. D5.8-2]QZT55837.1 SGNH/GDSL hydrolase family protein [Mycolicibacterium austroafricanum]QZY45031.1 SGNH/GDSL hydrolase family protein [Mycolicibacterium austroafricanum]
MGIRASRRSVALAAAATLASTGTAYVGARNLLSGQADQARRVIPKSWDIPPRADGVYAPGGGPVERWHRGVPFDLHLMIFGDSTATGYGCAAADEVPGVLIARGLAEESGLRIRLSTKAIVGATSKGLSGQIDAMFVAGAPPDAAVIMIGANDITKPNGIGPSARRLGRAVRRLRGSDAVVVVGTCPDFGVITAIPQPLRWVARSRGLRLARAQAAAVRAAGGVPVPFSDLLAPHFYKTPELLFSPDMFHPSAAGYELAAKQLLPALGNALGAFVTEDSAEAALESRTGEDGSLLGRLGGLSRLWRRSTGVPAPIVVAAG